jgi:lipopolysaccharide export system protein LptC
LFWNMSLVSSCIIVLMFKFFYVKYNNKNETVFTQPHSPTYNVD